MAEACLRAPERLPFGSLYSAQERGRVRGSGHWQVKPLKRNVVVSSIKHSASPPLYSTDALEPHMSKRAVEVHYEKHHKGYADKLNDQLEGSSSLQQLTLEELVKHAYNHGNPLPCFNNASQVWNHDFFWQSMEPGGGGRPEGELLSLIERDFGSFENLISDFKKAASSQFGAGWTWLSIKPTDVVPDYFYRAPRVLAGRPDERVKIGRLVVENTPNAINPLIWGHLPLLTIDVWEHAYYLDHLNGRTVYIDKFLESLVSWKAASARLQRAKNFISMEEQVYEDEDDGMTDAEWLAVHVNDRAAKRKSEEQEQAEAEKVAAERAKSKKNAVASKGYAMYDEEDEGDEE